MSEVMVPARAIPPGQIIRRELETRGWTQKNLAEIMGRPQQTISEIVRGHKQITSETALQLAEAFGTSAKFWVNLESQYRLHLARNEYEEAQIARKSKLYSLVPVSELEKRGWIKATKSVDELEQEICAFLEIATPDQQPQFAANFRQAQKPEREVAAQIAWVARVRQLARMQRVGEFDRHQTLKAVPDLLTYARAVEDVARVPAMLHNLGIHFVIVPHLPRTYLDGAAFKLEDHPVVALTLRYDRVDNFWFSLMHELAHILAGHEGLYLDNLDDLGDSAVEIEANQMAENWLIDPKALRAFVNVTQPYFSRKKILAFADRQGRHPGIVLGRLHYEEEVPQKNLRKLLVKVEPYLTVWIDHPGPNKETT